jgi:hypothetical protein
MYTSQLLIQLLKGAKGEGEVKGSILYILLQGKEENRDRNELGKKGIGTGRMVCRLEGVEGGRS